MATIPSLAPADDFPLLARTIEGRQVTYLDSAATSLKPRSVIDAVTHFYCHMGANIHRGDHSLSQEASERFEQVRHDVARHINALSTEIVFTANATDAANVLASGLGLERDDNVVASAVDHHSNILPWLSRCETRFLRAGRDGVIDLEDLPRLIDKRTKLVAITHISNVTAAVQPVREAIRIAHSHGVAVVVDAAQSAPHYPIDVVDLGCDFLTFSAHKMLGPSGVGVLYINESQADRVLSNRVGGGSPDHVKLDGYTLKQMPYRLEAGTPNIEGVLGFGEAVQYLKRLGAEKVAAHDRALSRLMYELFSVIPGVELLGPEDPTRRSALVSVVPKVAKTTARTLGRILSDSYKIMARSGTHCAHPYFTQISEPGALRISAYVYTSSDDIERAAGAVREIICS